MNRNWVVAIALVALALVRLTGVKPAALPNQNSADAIRSIVDRGNVSAVNLRNVAGVTDVSAVRFDPNAVVILTPGDDGQPGQAGMDDDRNGTPDNKLEMGAVGSDDLCLAPWTNGYADFADSQAAIPIGKGTFVPDNRSTERFIVSSSDGDWSWMVIPD